MRLSARSIQARTRSPGMAPRTSTTWPRWRAIIRPPDAGFSIVSSTCCPSNRLTVTRFQLPAASCQLPVTSYQFPPTAYRLPPTAYRIPHTAYRLPPTTHHARAQGGRSRRGAGGRTTRRWRVRVGRGIDELRHAHGAAPVVEELEDVGFAEFHAHRPAPRSLGVVALAVPIDAAADDRERHALRRPPGHLLEHGPRNADQVAFILAAQVRFDLAAVLGDVGHGRAAPVRSQMSRSPSSVRLASTCWMAPLSPEMTSARPPVAITTAASPPGSSARIRRVRPSTIST